MTTRHFYTHAEEWFEREMWDAKIRGQVVYSNALVDRFEGTVNTRFTLRTRKKLNTIATRTRNRLNQRYHVWKRRRSDYAARLGVPEKLIQRWYVLEWISDTGVRTNKMETLIAMFLERDFIQRLPNFPLELIDFDGSRPFFDIDFD